MRLHVQWEAMKRIYIHDVVADEPNLQTCSCQRAAIFCKVGQTDVHMYMSLEPVTSEICSLICPDWYHKHFQVLSWGHQLELQEYCNQESRSQPGAAIKHNNVHQISLGLILAKASKAENECRKGLKGECNSKDLLHTQAGWSELESEIQWPGVTVVETL